MSRTHQYSRCALALLTAVIFTACTTARPSATPERAFTTPQENRDALATLFDETQELIGGEWENTDDPTPMNCDVLGGGEGVQYSFLRSAAGVAELSTMQQLADEVAKLWRANGYTVTPGAHPIEGVIEVAGNNNQRGSLLFGINENAASLYGGSDCTPGSSEEIMEQLRDDEAKQGE